MKRTISNTLNLQKRAYISTETMLGTLYKDINDIPEKIKNSLPLLDYIAIDYDSIEKKLLSMMDDYTREKEKRILKVEKKEKEYLKKIIGKFLKNKEFTVKEFIFEDDGGIELDDQSHYYHGSRYDIKEEFNTKYEAKISLTIIIQNNNNNNNIDYKYDEDDDNIYWLNFEVEIYQDTDVGSDKVIFETHTSVDFTENFSYTEADYNDKDENLGLMKKDEVEKLMNKINKKYIADELILEKIKEEF